jgi:uncharacterized protein with GYD domain
MAKYLVKAKYNADGIKGLVTEGGSGRVAAVTKAVKSLGGKIESFHFALGEDDAFVIVDIEEASLVALSLAINATGVVTVQAVPLLTAKQVDEALTKNVKYKAPGA